MRSQFPPLSLHSRLLQLFLLLPSNAQRSGDDFRERLSTQSLHQLQFIRPSCKKAVRRLSSFLGHYVSFSPQDLWETCCDLSRFDVYGHRSGCFKGASTWEVQYCCASLQLPWHFDIILRKVVTSVGRQRNQLLERRLAKVRNSLREFAIVTYHKTGTFVATQLLGYDLPQGPLSVLLLQNASKRYEASLWPNASLEDQQIQGISPWMRESSTGRIALLYNPPECDLAPQRRLQFTLAAGKLIHFIRRPSDVILSSYVYHLQGSVGFEYWMRTTNPPNCHHCDFEAWDMIFRPCTFQCTFFDRLQQLDVKEGLRVEIFRARWTIIKMLNNFNQWTAASNVLHMQVRELQTNLTASLLKIGKFLKPNLKPTSSLGRFVSMAKSWGLDLQYAKHQCALECPTCCNRHLRLALNHASMHKSVTLFEAREVLKQLAEWREFIKPADDFFDKLTN
eukprot:Skav231063  [mRNA]  locus=scaffold768:131113:132462:+ [translate_table: standard]